MVGFQIGNVDTRDKANRRCIGPTSIGWRTLPTIQAGVGRYGTDDPETWSIEDRLTFLELKVYDRLGGSGSKRSTVYQEFTLLDMYFGHAMVRLIAIPTIQTFQSTARSRSGSSEIEKPFAKVKQYRSLHND